MPQQTRQLLTAGQAANRLGMTRRQFARVADCIPQAFPRRERGHRRYWSSDVDKWTEQQHQAANAPVVEPKSEREPSQRLRRTNRKDDPSWINEIPDW